MSDFLHHKLFTVSHMLENITFSQTTKQKPHKYAASYSTYYENCVFMWFFLNINSPWPSHKSTSNVFSCSIIPSSYFVQYNTLTPFHDHMIQVGVMPGLPLILYFWAIVFLSFIFLYMDHNMIGRGRRHWLCLTAQLWLSGLVSKLDQHFYLRPVGLCAPLLPNIKLHEGYCKVFGFHYLSQWRIFPVGWNTWHFSAQDSLQSLSILKVSCSGTETGQCLIIGQQFDLLVCSQPLVCIAYTAAKTNNMVYMYI